MKYYQWHFTYEKCAGKKTTFKVLHRFGQEIFAEGGLILGTSQFTQLPQLPLKLLI